MGESSRGGESVSKSLEYGSGIPHFEVWLCLFFGNIDLIWRNGWRRPLQGAFLVFSFPSHRGLAKNTLVGQARKP
jgi:hypothetical protein